jgi:anthranilate synthase component 2
MRRAGYLGFNGNLDLAIAIRTGIVKDGTLHVQAAAGIVADSISENEWRETQNKARSACGGRAGPSRPRRAARGGGRDAADDRQLRPSPQPVQYLGGWGRRRVARNDELSVDEVERLAPERIVLSPGPCTPNEAGICLDLIGRFRGRVPILGVCLGHQAIGQAFGGRIVHAKALMHGKVSRIHHAGGGVFRGLPTPYDATRYHSLAIERASCPGARGDGVDQDGEIMGVRHRSLAIEGVQFPPESFLTQHGHALLRNFLSDSR